MSRIYSKGKSGGPTFNWESIEDKDWENYNPHFFLKQIGEYTDKINADLRRVKREAQEELTNLWTERGQLVDKVAEAEDHIGELTKEKANLEKRIEVLESDLGASKKQCAEVEKEVRKLNRMVAESRDKYDLLQERYEEATKALSEERMRLADRISREANHEVNVLLNRMASSLVSDYKGMDKLLSAPITMETGENLKAQLKTLFNKLIRLGVDFDKISK